MTDSALRVLLAVVSPFLKSQATQSEQQQSLQETASSIKQGNYSIKQLVSLRAV